MSQQRPQLQAEARERLGTRYTRRLRRAGKLPAVIYGHGEAPAHVTINQEELVHHLEHGAHLLDITTNGTNETCLIKDLQFDHLGTDVIHIDLTRVSLSERVEVTVPLLTKGRDDNAALKGANTILEEPVTDITITCRADSIPDHIEVDIRDLPLGESIHAGDLKLPEGIELEIDEETVILAIHEVKEEVEVEADAAATQPEVITEKPDAEKSKED